MPRNITVTLADGSTHVYQNAPDNITPGIVAARAVKDFGKGVTNIDGGRGQTTIPTRRQPAVPVQTRQQAVQAVARNAVNTEGDAGNFLTSLGAGIRRSMFGIPERLAAAGERFLPTAITGNKSDASYSDILDQVRAKTDAEMGRSTAGNIAGNVIGAVATGRAAAGAAGAVATRASAAASPLIARGGNVLQNLMTFRKGRTIANAAKVITTGAAAGATQAVGEGSSPIKGAEYGAAGAALLGGGFKAAQVVTRPFRDFARLSSAGQILSRLTSATQEQLGQRATAYREATGAEPTLFELLPLADRNKILKQAVVGRDNVVEAASDAIRTRANNLGPEMAGRARTILAPQRDAAVAGMTDDLATARGGTPDPGDAPLATSAARSPTDMSTLRDTEARAIMAPHQDTPVANTFGDILPQTPQNINGTVVMQDADPAVSAAIRSAVPSGYRAPDQGVTAGDLSDMIQTLRGDLGKGGIEARTAQRAIDHLQTTMAERAPDAAAAHTQMTDAYAARSRMMEGMKEGDATRLRDDVQVGTSRRQARTVRNAYDTLEGETGRALGQGNQVLNSLEGSPEEALRSTVAMSRNSTGRQLAQNVGDDEAMRIIAAARAQDTSAQALSSASRTVQSGSGDAAGVETLVQSLAALHPSSFITTKAGAVRKLLDMTYIPENRARTMVDMIFSQNPAMVQRALSAIGNERNGAGFMKYLGGVAGQLSGEAAAPDSMQEEPEAVAPQPVPDDLSDLQAPEPDAAPQDAADPSGTPVDPSNSPYADHLQHIYDTENPDLLDLVDRVQHQESGGRQHGDDGKPLTSGAGAVGIMQVMPKTAPEAARLAGLDFDREAYHHDPVYNKLLGTAYLSQMLRYYKGDVAKATAAYNAGPGAVDAAIAKARGTGWINHLPPETQDYVQKVA